MKVCGFKAIALAVAVSGIVSAAQGISFKDIHFWVGEGTNQCAVMINWDAYGTALAWGYRWNGTATNVAEIVKRIVREDPRLVMSPYSSGYFNPGFFGYDVNDCHPTWDMVNGAASDVEAPALIPAADWSSYWSFFGPFNGSSFTAGEYNGATSGADQTIPTNNDWFMIHYGSPFDPVTWEYVPVLLPEPEPAESPYGYKVVASSTTASNPLYKDPSVVLGRPAMYMPNAQGGVVNPANPAFQKGEIFSLESEGTDEVEPGEEDGPGYVTIAFDHDVIDDPANPFGLDFIVYGNSLAVKTDKTYYTESTDPSSVTFTNEGAPELGKVEVSQDGKTWYTDSSWKTSDGFAPTLGYLYEPTKADPFIYAGNQWWGRATLATRPIDPKVDFANLEGKTLAQVCQYYNGSAGGTGYDISRLDLPVNAQGRKWFRYVRISSVYAAEEEGDFGYTSPEVDAVADVAPVSAYEKWVEANYTDWTTAWKSEVTGEEVVAANGLANGVNYILGLSANETAEGVSFSVASFKPGEKTHELKLVSKAEIKDGCGLVVKQAEKLKGKWVSEMPVIASSERREDGLYVTTLTVSNQGKFVKLALDIQ